MYVEDFRQLRVYQRAFRSEAAETLVWLDFAQACSYVSEEEIESLGEEYKGIIGGLVKMMNDPDRWCGPSTLVREDDVEYTPSP